MPELRQGHVIVTDTAIWRDQSKTDRIERMATIWERSETPHIQSVHDFYMVYFTAGTFLSMADRTPVGGDVAGGVN